MFTLEQIDEVHDRLGSAETLFRYVQELRSLGVRSSDSFVTDGHSEYFGENGHAVVSPPAHEWFAVADVSDRESFLEHLRQHGEGATSYVAMSKGLADSGVEKWTFDTRRMTVTYYDKAGTELLTETLHESG